MQKNITALSTSTFTLFFLSLFGFWLCAQWSVPLWPVPMTLQTLYVLTLAHTLSRDKSSLFVGSALLLHSLGVPLFLGSGPLFGMTAGYRFALLGATFLYQPLYRRVGQSAFLILALFIILFGSSWLALWTGWHTAIVRGCLPFLLPEVLKWLLFLVGRRAVLYFW